MPRNLTIQCPEAPPVSLPPGYVRETYTIKVITPIFGGGVETGRNDPITPFRVPAIRGHLRFWWRATSGVRAAKTIAELRRKEGEIWGTTRDADGKPRESRVSLKVDQPADRGTVTAVAEHPSYVFGMLGADKAEAKCLSYDQPFTLTVTCPGGCLADQVRVAIWAWTNFGGLGARTRRGCGALFCPQTAPSGDDLDSLKTWYSEWTKLSRKPINPNLAKVPALAESLLVVPIPQGAAPPPAMNAWEQAVKVFRKFRQGENVGRNPRGPNKNHPGRSRWPEPDAVQRLIKDPGWDWKHKPPREEFPDAFPRAAFGLPIQFVFAECPTKPKSVTAKLTVKGETDRMASPIILRPLGIDGGKAVPAILRLSVADLDGVVLKATKPQKVEGEDKEVDEWAIGPDKLRGCHLSKYKNSPMSGSSSGSALEAFLAYAGECGYKAVHP